MTTAIVKKEIRALLPVWAACTVLVFAADFSRDWWVVRASVLAYAVGAFALGALSIGHEYSDRTLSLLLSQPVDRRKMLLLKHAVLIVMLAALTAAAWVVLFDTGDTSRGMWQQPPAALLPALCGLLVAPWLTMRFRSPLAGAVLAMMLPGSIVFTGDMLASYLYSADSPEGLAFKTAYWSRGMIALCAIAPVLGWRAYMRLEAIEGTGENIHILQALRGASRARAGSPTWTLFKKELHLQQMTFLVAGLYVLGCIAVVVAERMYPGVARFSYLYPLTILHAVVLSLLAGSTASAEERQLGTIQSQMLLPIPASHQWAVKAIAAIVISVGLAIGLPAVLVHVAVSGDDLPPVRAWQNTGLAVVLLTSFSLYVSSLSASAVRALIFAIVGLLGAVLFVRTLLDAVGSLAALEHPLIWSLRSSRAAHIVGETGGSIVFAGLLLLLLACGFKNHRSADRSTPRVLRQIVGLGAYTAAVMVLAAILGL